MGLFLAHKGLLLCVFTEGLSPRPCEPGTTARCGLTLDPRRTPVFRFDGSRSRRGRFGEPPGWRRNDDCLALLQPFAGCGQEFRTL
jgi:hypothetical protein